MLLDMNRVNRSSGTGQLMHRLNRSPWPFFALAFGWSWLFWSINLIAGFEMAAGPGIILFAVGGLGPALAAIILTQMISQPADRQDYWRRIIDIRRIGWFWLAAVVLTVPLAAVLALLTGLVVYGDFPVMPTAIGFLRQPLLLLPFALSTLVFGPLPEEIGWRGYALDRLQHMLNPLSASLALGVLWVIWHIPLFLMRGSGFAILYPVDSSGFWYWVAGLLGASILMSWIYNHTQRSTLSAILFHFVMNATGGFLNLSGTMQSYFLIWLALLGVGVAFFWLFG